MHRAPLLAAADPTGHRTAYITLVHIQGVGARHPSGLERSHGGMEEAAVLDYAARAADVQMDVHVSEQRSSGMATPAAQRSLDSLADSGSIMMLPGSETYIAAGAPRMAVNRIDC